MCAAHTSLSVAVRGRPRSPQWALLGRGSDNLFPALITRISLINASAMSRAKKHLFFKLHRAAQPPLPSPQTTNCSTFRRNQRLAQSPAPSPEVSAISSKSSTKHFGTVSVAQLDLIIIKRNREADI
ncbi:hypothetical protein AAHA92_07155 [Salvia divinorum]|uniref:Uncharacterized protein n=1 Tax=Salvia divinorum TaxID=28513 RepID=A0ABD1I8R9_SALDI